jgi:acid phosphatase
MSLPMASERVTHSAALGTSGSTSESLGWLAPPPGLELTQVHYLIRHGERTPVRERLQKANPAIPVRWNLCHASKDFHVRVLDVGKGDHIQTRDWKGQFLQGMPGQMKVQRRVETTDDKDNALSVRPGDW